MHEFDIKTWFIIRKNRGNSIKSPSVHGNNFDDTLMIRVLAILLSNNVCTVVIKSFISSRKEKVKMQANKGIIAQFSPLLILHIQQS